VNLVQRATAVSSAEEPPPSVQEAGNDRDNVGHSKFRPVRDNQIPEATTLPCQDGAEVRDETDVDEDLDAKVAGAVAEVWGYYDPKNLGSIPKKQCQKFFTDGLELYAIRKGIPSAKVIGQGVNKGKALDDCYERMSGTNPNTSRQQFESYIYTYDLDEALGPLLGTQGGQPVPSRLPANMMFDPTTLPKETGNVDLTKVKLRDYNSTMDG